MKRLLAIALVLFSPSAMAQHSADPALVGELMAFHGSRAIVSAMTIHCYETTGLDPAYRAAYDNWYLRNIGFLDLANRVAAKLDATNPEAVAAAETYGGTQIMSAYNQAPDKDVFCRSFLEQVNSGALDIDRQLPDTLRKAQELGSH